MSEEAIQGGGRESGGRWLLVVSGQVRKTTSDRDKIPALSRFRGTLFDHLRLSRRQGKLPTNLDIAIFTHVTGLVLENDLVGKVEPEETRAHDGLYRQFNRILEQYDVVRLVVTDHDYQFLSKADGLTRSTLDWERLTGYTSDKWKKIRSWLQMF